MPSFGPGEEAEILIELTDLPGSPLGSDQSDPLSQGLRGLAVTVFWEPENAVTSVLFERAGVTSALAPRYESQTSRPGRESWVLGLTTPLELAHTPEVVGRIRLQLSPYLPPGNSVAFHFDAERTGLSNFNGSIMEDVQSGTLVLEERGSLTQLFLDDFESGDDGAWSSGAGAP